jgi:Cu/Zn superoxide dismutase
LSPGSHTLDIHVIGKCDAADSFKSVADHFEPRGHNVEGGPHAGVMPNQFGGVLEGRTCLIDTDDRA